MLRISDTVKHLIIINALFFIGTYVYNEQLFEWFALWFPESENFGFWQVVSHMFMHGGLMHIFFNMYALLAFGSPLEQMWGRKKFLFFYFSAGIGAALIHTGVNYYHFNEGLQVIINAGFNEKDIFSLINSGQYDPRWYDAVPKNVVDDFLNILRTPAVGASGAIYGILVAFGMLFPNTELFLLFVPVPIKAKYFIPALIALDLFSGVTGYSIFGAGIAHFAHVGGALFGFLMMLYWKKNQFKNNRWDQ